MNVTTVKALADSRGLNQSDLARLAGVTRQRVSQWFHRTLADSPVNIGSTSLKALAEGLGVKADKLLAPLPLLEQPEALRRETTKLLWDGLYPDLVSFVIDVGRGRLEAVARLVQIYGLFASARMIGKSAWTSFPRYKKYLHPVRRRELEVLWSLRTSPTIE